MERRLKSQKNINNDFLLIFYIFRDFDNTVLR